MRESNFAFPAQNRACVCITSQLYDRRALDTNAPLPLFNSLTHLTYLTSTSPRIREIMTTDGGLERLVRILHDFCMCPPPPENAAILYGLSSPSAHITKLVPTLNPKSFDKAAALRFSLAFQSVVNIGVRGSELIRGRVVQAGTLDVVGCILEAWLAGKGFAIGPGVTANGTQRETREQRIARRQAQQEIRQREQATHLARALQRQAERSTTEGTIRATRTTQTLDDDTMDVDMSSSEGQAGSRDTDTSTEPSSNVTPLGSNTPTGAVLIPNRDRSGTVIARPVWDQAQTATAAVHHRRNYRGVSRLPVPPASEGPSTSHSTDTSRPDTETEDDGDVDMDHDSTRESDAPVSGASSPDRRNPSPDASTIRAAATHSRRAVGIVSDEPNTAGASLDLNSDAHIIINDQGVAVDGVGVEDGIVSLETNDDFAMGAPPGAPGAINGPPAGRQDVHTGAGERTPRAGTITLPATTPTQVPPVPATAAMRLRNAEGGTVPDQLQRARLHTLGVVPTPTRGVGAGTGLPTHHHHHHRESDAGPYRDEDVLLALQLLAYLSKYPHVRQAFYKPRPSFHPATVQENLADEPAWRASAGPSTSKQPATAPAKESNSFLKAFASAAGRGKEKEKASPSISLSSSSSTSAPSANAVPRMTNVFSLVERFTYRPSSSEVEAPTPPPTLPTEIQYWAGVIMRNACRKDDSRGGIRQCANMMCGRWESFPREFAKCRRCRKAKYCGKECQSIAWSEGHRFWCSAKDNDEDPDNLPFDSSSRAGSSASGSHSLLVTAGGTVTGRAERRAAREQERQARHADEVPVRTARIAATLAQPVVPDTPTTDPQRVRPAANNQGPLHWAFSPLAMRRPRTRADDGALNPNEPQAPRAQVTRLRRQGENAQVDIELAPEVRRQLVHIIQGNRRPERIEVATGTADAGPSRIREAGEAGEDDGDEAMVIG